eukprot:jgi/Mesen1/978/ME000012S00525
MSLTTSHGFKLPSTQLEEGEEAAMAGLLGWAQRHGARTDGVSIVRDPGGHGWGLVAASACPRGHVLASLPPQLHLSADQHHQRGEADEDAAAAAAAAGLAALHAVSSAVPDERWAVRLGLRVVHERERARASFWAPYVRCLPRTFSLPMFFAAGELAELQYEPVLAQVKIRGRYLHELATSTAPAVIARMGSAAARQYQLPGLNDLGWGTAAAASRAFRVRGPDHSPSLLPLVALHPLEAGAPVSISYGELDNDELLLDYGFIVRGNPHERFSLPFANVMHICRMFQLLPSLTATQAQNEERLVDRLGLLHGPSSVVKVGPDYVDERLRAGLRVLLAPHQQQQAEALRHLGGKSGGATSAATEAKVLKCVMAVCAVALSSFPTSADDDRRQLQAAGLTQNLVDVLNFRLAKKESLANMIAKLKESQDKLRQRSK